MEIITNASKKGITKRQFAGMLPEGWIIEAFPKGRHNNCTWFCEEQLLVAITKGDHRLTASSGGDTEIVGKKGKVEFYCTGTTVLVGRLTKDLVENGEYLLNNWIDIEYADEAARRKLEATGNTVFFDDYGITWCDVCYYVSEACDILSRAAREINKGEHPFYSNRPFPIDFSTEPVA